MFSYSIHSSVRFIQRLSGRAQFFSVDRSFPWSCSGVTQINGQQLGWVLSWGWDLSWKLLDLSCFEKLLDSDVLFKAWPLVRFCARRKISWHHQLVLHSGAPHPGASPSCVKLLESCEPLISSHFLGCDFSLWPSLIPFNSIKLRLQEPTLSMFSTIMSMVLEDARRHWCTHCAGWTRGALILWSLYSQPTH